MQQKTPLYISGVFLYLAVKIKNNLIFYLTLSMPFLIFLLKLIKILDLTITSAPINHRQFCAK